MMQDTNKNVIVTASSKGLGLAIAQKFSERDYGVIIHGRDSRKIEEAKRLVRNVVCTVQGDLRDQTTIDRLYESAIEHSVSVLVNNAAIPCYRVPLSHMTNDQIDESLMTNLASPILLSYKLYPVLSKNSPGGIININSIVGLEPKKYRSIHSATKWGLKGFSKSLRIEASDDNIRIMNVYPSRIMTAKEYTYGLDPSDVADLIYNELQNPEGLDELIIDGRPKEFRPSE